MRNLLLFYIDSLLPYLNTKALTSNSEAQSAWLAIRLTLGRQLSWSRTLLPSDVLKQASAINAAK